MLAAKNPRDLILAATSLSHPPTAGTSEEEGNTRRCLQYIGCGSIWYHHHSGLAKLMKWDNGGMFFSEKVLDSLSIVEEVGIDIMDMMFGEKC